MKNDPISNRRSLTWWRCQDTTNTSISLVSLRTSANGNMILNRASGHFSTSFNTRIFTPLIYTSSRMEAIRVINAFWSTIWRTTDIVQQAGACGLRTDHSALRIRSARIRWAWISKILERWLCHVGPSTLNKWITSVSICTSANGIVVHRQTFSVQSTGTWTRIRTLVLDASLVLRTLRAHYTFWPTCRRNTDESWLTKTHCMSIVHATVAIRSTRRWFTRIER